MVYIPKDFIPHAASLRHTFVHCGRFVTAAPRRSLGSVSVPMWPANLSVRLRVVALVGRYPANQLIRYRPLPGRLAPLSTTRCLVGMSPGITRPFGRLSRTPGHVSDTLLTRPPLAGIAAGPYDLHVLATPPAFRLSQDQTLQLNFLARPHPDARCGVLPLSGRAVGRD